MKKELLQLLGKQNIKFNEPIKNHCTFKIGGNAKYFVSPNNFLDLFQVVDMAKKNKVKYKIIGSASNLLFSDKNFDGIIICTKNINTYCVINENRIVASAGMLLSDLQKVATENCLSGLEFVAGIPGTVGGAIYMNAGANGSEISDTIRTISFLKNGNVITKKKEELNWEYRKSEFVLQDDIILFAEFELIKKPQNQIIETINNYYIRRNETQPKGFSAGCVFKKCGDVPAGLLIDRAGLKGLKINDAEISNIHANFIINNGNAKFADVISLIDTIQQKISWYYGKNLELEIEIIK